MEGPVCLGMYAGVCRPYHALCFYFMRPKWIADWHTGAKRKACCQVSLSSGHRRYPNILEASKSCATYNFLTAATPNVVSATEAHAYQNHVPSFAFMCTVSVCLRAMRRALTSRKTALILVCRQTCV